MLYQHDAGYTDQHHRYPAQIAEHKGLRKDRRCILSRDTQSRNDTNRVTERTSASISAREIGDLIAMPMSCRAAPAQTGSVNKLYKLIFGTVAKRREVGIIRVPEQEQMMRGLYRRKRPRSEVTELRPIPLCSIGNSRRRKTGVLCAARGTSRRGPANSVSLPNGLSTFSTFD